MKTETFFVVINRHRRRCRRRNKTEIRTISFKRIPIIFIENIIYTNGLERERVKEKKERKLISLSPPVPKNTAHFKFWPFAFLIIDFFPRLNKLENILVFLLYSRAVEIREILDEITLIT